MASRRIKIEIHRGSKEAMVNQINNEYFRYVLLREKNSIFSDNEIKKKYFGKIGR
jgi:hypothetical protein